MIPLDISYGVFVLQLHELTGKNNHMKIARNTGFYGFHRTVMVMKMWENVAALSDSIILQKNQISG